MGQKETTAVKNTESSTLVDFLYIDRERLDSLISQTTIGTLRSVTKTNGTSESSLHSGSAGVPVIKGTISDTKTSNAASTEQYDPFYTQLIKFLNSVQSEAFDALTPQLLSTPRIMTVTGSLAIRDTNNLEKIFPIIAKNPSAFGFPSGSNARKMMKSVGDLFSFLHLSTNMDLTLSDGLRVSGPLKDLGLQIKSADISQQYGNLLPGTWYVFGIFDYSSTISAPASNQPIDCTLNKSIDDCAKAISNLYGSTPYKVIPIVIFRPVQLL